MSTASNGSDRSARQAKIQAAAPKESKLKPILGVIIALVAIAAIAAAIVFGMNKTDTSTAGGGSLPRGAQSETGGIMLNATDPGQNVPVLDIYEDFQCPACGFYHKGLGKTVDDLASSGKAKVVVHIKTFLDDNFKVDHSMKAGNAASCASNVSPQAFMKMHDGIFASQPAQEGAGWPDMTFSKLAEQSGITGDAKKTYDSCVANGTYNGYLKKVEDQSAKDGVTQTPTYRINGKKFDLAQVTNQKTQQVEPQALVKAIQDATKK